MNSIALAILQSEDSFAAIDYLSTLPDAVAATRAFIDLARHLYWKEKALPPAVAIARAGIQYGLDRAAAEAESNPTRAAEIRGLAKAMAYDLASFTWPGWDEPGIVIGSSDLAVGLDAARTNLRLARELEKGDLPMSRAYWMLAAHQLAAGQFDAARENFTRAAQRAAAAGSEAEQQMAIGYVQVARLVQTPGDPAATEELSRIKTALQPLKDGPFFADQLDTALKVFSHGSPQEQGEEKEISNR